MDKIIINTEKAPAALGPYSQAVKVGNLLYTSGQLPINQAGELVNDDIQKATAVCLENVKAILKDMNDFAAMNEVYGKYFNANPPARSCVQPGKLPKDALIEIEVIAIVE